MTNPQDKNVGNLGDIFKHGALVRLAQLAASRAIRAPVTYIDTHAYLLDAPWEEPLKWKRAINREMAQHPAYTDYVRREKERLDAGEPYRCSAGLVLDIISERSYHAILAEEEDDTRRELKSQVRSNGFRTDFVLEKASQLSEIKPPRTEEEEEDDPAGGSLLALVDPFELDPDEWEAIADGLEQFVEEESEGIIEVFHFDPDTDEPDWPDPPKHFVGPIAVLNRTPYHLAVYATESMIRRTLDEIEKLGWTILHDDD